MSRAATRKFLPRFGDGQFGWFWSTRKNKRRDWRRFAPCSQAKCCRSPHRRATITPPDSVIPSLLSKQAQRDETLKIKIGRVFVENFSVYGVPKV